MSRADAGHEAAVDQRRDRFNRVRQHRAVPAAAIANEKGESMGLGGDVVEA